MFEPEELMARIADLEGQLEFYEQQSKPANSPRADELIACLEGEIAKRDAELCERTEEVEHALADLNNALAELSAIKAQSEECPAYKSVKAVEVSHPSFGVVDYARDAAPVSEPKAQGVVMPDPYGWVAAGIFYTDRESAICAAGKTPCIEVYSRNQINALENRSLQRQEVAEDLARQLSASCAEIRNLRSLNADPVQQVSVPDGWKLVPVEPTPEMISAGNDAAHAGGCDLYQLTREVMNAYPAMLAAAPAAPEQ